MKKILLFVFAILILLSGICLAATPEEARVGLAQLKISYNENAFLRVIQQKDNAALSLFLDAGMDPNYISSNNTTPLTTAAYFNNYEAVKILMEKPNIDLNWKDNKGRGAADIAELFGNTEIVKLFREKGIEPAVTREPALSDIDKQKALSAGRTLAQQKNIAFVSNNSAKVSKGGFFSAVEASGDAYWLTPFAGIATESILSEKTFEPIKVDRLTILANSYQARVVFTFNQYNANNLGSIRLVAIQNGNNIFPYSVMYSFPQFDGSWAHMGVTAYFNAYDINPLQPVELRVVTKASKDMVFTFDQKNGADRTFYDANRIGYNF